MARRLLLGRAGTGKTHHCLARLALELAAGRKALLLVPTYSQAEHLRYLLLDR
jgi:RecG-like helicase